ncbi:hypothetical protein EJ03DRAFT_185870 [Teratosphaeria nubilosa]|uniref:Uncharacterized protein n=1 Tax=Teratosphaeria nubilosa TaxID=161662 RepID=A0A6G1LHW7_9PEZI|nr:hypothetical protein EJ03DRAFT_185870 [Teratosphaeria nubilosa]
MNLEIHCHPPKARVGWSIVSALALFSCRLTMTPRSRHESTTAHSESECDAASNCSDAWSVDSVAEEALPHYQPRPFNKPARIRLLDFLPAMAVQDLSLGFSIWTTYHRTRLCHTNGVLCMRMDPISPTGSLVTDSLLELPHHCITLCKASATSFAKACGQHRKIRPLTQIPVGSGWRSLHRSVQCPRTHQPGHAHEAHISDGSFVNSLGHPGAQSTKCYSANARFFVCSRADRSFRRRCWYHGVSCWVRDPAANSIDGTRVGQISKKCPTKGFRLC